MPGWNSQMTAGATQTDKVQINRSVPDRKFRGPRRHMGGAPNSTWRGTFPHHWKGNMGTMGTE